MEGLRTIVETITVIPLRLSCIEETLFMAMARGSQLERRPLNLRAVPVGSSPIESFRRGTPRFWARVYRDALPDAQGWRSTACPASVWDPRVLPATKTRRGREKSNRPALPGRGRIVPEASGTLVLGPTNLPSHPFRGRRPRVPLRHLSSTSHSHAAPCAAWRRGVPAGLPRGAGWPAARTLGGSRGCAPADAKRALEFLSARRGGTQRMQKPCTSD